MIKIIEEKTVPTATISCGNCGSLLEYGNADLTEEINNDVYYRVYNHLKNYYFICPVCGCKVYASWLTKKEENKL